MGAGMARHLLCNGVDLTVYDVRAGTVDTFAADGARLTTCLADSRGLHACVPQPPRSGGIRDRRTGRSTIRRAAEGLRRRGLTWSICPSAAGNRGGRGEPHFECERECRAGPRVRPDGLVRAACPVARVERQGHVPGR
ncbi:hypothetical protein ABZ863_30335 [Saccharomonospora sp. NPDC046836]|uniref:hypothetical protein n=1 Tax=Saccharomonospora sp. NPDC046836 TaxID=3156921 RepID=UPI0033D045E1